LSTQLNLGVPAINSKVINDDLGQGGITLFAPSRIVKQKGTSDLLPLAFYSYESGQDCFTMHLYERHFAQNFIPLFSEQL